MKKIYVTILFALMAMTSFAQEKNDTTYVMMDFTLNPWNYPVTEVTSKWYPDYKDLDSPGAILKETDFWWPLDGWPSSRSNAEIGVTVYPVDLDEYDRVSVYASYELNDAEAAALGVNAGLSKMLYTTPGTTVRFVAPKGYKFGKIVFYLYRNQNILVGDEYDEEFEYTYNDATFKQKLKVWTPASPKANSFDYSIWEGDEKNILFNYPYFSAVFVRIDVRLVPDGSSGITELPTGAQDSHKAVSLDGRTVNKSDGLRKGIYVIDGKKQMVR